MKFKAYSKVNLLLNFTQKTDSKSKKHFLQSIFLKNKKIFDEIEINDSKQLKVSYFLNNKEIVIENDVVTKVIRWFEDNFLINQRVLVEIKIIKNIAFCSGLGGSSTDAATVLNYLLSKYKIQLKKEHYLDLSKNISSDLCFFLFEYDLAYVSGIGEQIKKLNYADLNINVYMLNNKQSNSNILAKYINNLNKTDIKNITYKKAQEIIATNNWKLLFNNLQDQILLNDEQLKEKFRCIQQNNKDYITMISGSGNSIFTIKYHEIN